MNRVTLEPLFILHRRPYRNTSLIVECFTKNHGRIAAVARSARGLKSRYKNILQPFTPLLASWMGRGDLKTLGSVEMNGAPYDLNSKELLSGFYLNELVLALLQHEDPHPELFDHYASTLAQAAQTSKNVELQTALRLFEKNLLKEMGYALPLKYEAQTHELIQEQFYYRYYPDKGFVRCEQASLTPGILSGESLIALEQNKNFSETNLKELKYLMRIAISYLNDKPIKSRELLYV